MSASSSHRPQWLDRRLAWVANLFGARKSPIDSDLPDPSPTTIFEPHATHGAGQPPHLGRFIVEREIGRGAMGVLVQARDPRTEQPVAIKTMALGHEFQGDALEEARSRFYREAELAGRLHHPDIVSILEAGEDNGLAYIAMEFLEGEDLSTHVQESTLLPVPDVLAITARVADALAYAHAQGVTHRDVKPANILIDAGTDSVKVTDFGIARIVDSTQTRTGMVLGTPSFMSPEQMAGDRVDGRSDLYSLGVTLYQLLTAQLPYRGDSMAQLIRAITSDPVPDIRALRPELPQELADIVSLALEKRPEVRYANGRELSADLRTVLRAMNDAGHVNAGHNSQASP